MPDLQQDPLILIPPDVLSRHNARLLDPATAVQVAGQTPIRSTVYIADKLIISPHPANQARAVLESAAMDLGLVIAPPTEERTARTAALRGCAARSTRAAAQRYFPTTVQLVPAPGRAVAPDAWEVLQAFRAKAGSDPGLIRQVGLDHLLTGLPHVIGSPVDADAVSSYGRPGWGGRMPVSWQGGPLARGTDVGGQRRPVVAVLDTGCGWHDWFDGVVTRNVVLGTTPIGLQDPGDDPEASGVLLDPLEGELDPDSGHGTFISGLIRQVSPDADILAVRVMASDGAVAEHVLIDALTLLALRQEQAQAGDGDLLDVVSLSLGYYHEQADDVNTDQPLLVPLAALAETGVAVVVAAGNDATTRPMFPAAFTPQAPGAPVPLTSGAAPLLSVGALNPDGTHALFSNAGDWVPNHRQGVNLVSTFPMFDGSLQPRNRVDSPWGVRASFDRDNFSSGFGTWSGTSFAAPLLAGELAQALASGACGPLVDTDPAACVARAWAAVTATTHLVAP